MVETAGLRDGGWLDNRGTPLSDAARIVERFTRPDFDHLIIEVTVDDRKHYTEPWTVAISQTLMRGDELIEFVCLENEKSIVHMPVN